MGVLARHVIEMTYCAPPTCPMQPGREAAPACFILGVTVSETLAPGASVASGRHSPALNVAGDFPGRQCDDEKLAASVGRDGVELIAAVVGMLPLLEVGVIPFPEVARLCVASEHLLRWQACDEACISAVCSRAHGDAGFGQLPMAYPSPVIVFVEQQVGIYRAYVFGGRYAGKAEWLMAGKRWHVARQGIGSAAAGRVAGVELRGALDHRKRRFVVGRA